MLFNDFCQDFNLQIFTKYRTNITGHHKNNIFKLQTISSIKIVLFFYRITY